MSDSPATMENSSSDATQGSAIVTRCDYNKDSIQSANTQKDEVLFKVIELEQKLQQFDTVCLEQFRQIHNMIGRIFDRPTLRIPSKENVAENPIGRSQSLPPQIPSQHIDGTNRQNSENADKAVSDGAMSPSMTRTIADTNANDCESDDEDIHATQSQTKSSRIEECQRKSPVLRCEQSRAPKRSTPYRIVGTRYKTNDAITKSPSNISAVFLWVIIIVMVSFIAFVVPDAVELATVETVAKLTIDYMRKIKSLMMQSLIDHTKRLYPIDQHHLHNE